MRWHCGHLGLRSLFLALFLCLCGEVALADDLAEAKRHFEQGVALFNDGDYNAALSEFQVSYKQKENPLLLYNIGLCERMLFRYADAVSTLTRYLKEADPRPERRQEVERAITELSALLADVHLEITPKGAAVTIDGRSVGRAPLPMVRLATGQRSLEIQAEGYKPLRRELIIAAGIPVRLKVELIPLPRTGIVRIKPTPLAAQVFLDGQKRLVGEAVELKAGGHSLVVRAPNHLPYQVELTISAGEERTVDVVLIQEKQPIYKKWWFWTAGSLVVAGAAAAAIAIPLSTDTRDSLRGTLSPGVGRVD